MLFQIQYYLNLILILRLIKVTDRRFLYRDCIYIHNNKIG